MTQSNRGFRSRPHRPAGPPSPADGVSLAEGRDLVSTMTADDEVESEALSLVEDWTAGAEGAAPLRRLERLLDDVRAAPRGDVRLRKMNTLVRTLGRRDVLATLLDALRMAATEPGAAEEPLTRLSRQATKHALYGWAGDTLVSASGDEPTAATIPPDPLVTDFLDFSPAKWGLNLHVWQPNPIARGFDAPKRPEPGVVVEPPHSHPGDFVSMVAVGTLHQSYYEQIDLDQVDGTADLPGRYAGSILEHVDGVWPPHTRRSRCGLRTIEDRVELAAGQSYAMTCEQIHDVEVEVATGRSQPAVTLFLSTEAIVLPHVYMASSMLDFHDSTPSIERAGTPLAVEAWSAKLEAVAAYLRGSITTLDLAPVVDHTNEYAFFHR